MLFKSLIEPFTYKKISLETAEENKKARAANTWKTIKRIASYFEDNKLTLSLVILMVITSSLLGLLGPYLVGTAIDDFIVTKKSSGLLILLGALLLIYIFHSISIFLQNFWMVGIAQSIVYRLRKQLFEHFHQLPISFYDTRQQGELMSRVTNDIDNINNTLNESIIQVFASVITIVGTVLVMFFLSPLLTVITMSIIPLLLIGMRWITKRTGPLFKIQQRNLGELNGYIEEITSGQQIVKSFAQEERVEKEFALKNDALQQSGFWALTIGGFIPKVMNSLNFISFTLIAFFGGLLAVKGHITVGVIVIFSEYARQFTRPLNELSNQFNILLSAVAGAERVFSILDEDVEEIDESDAVDIKAPKGHFVFEDVTFAYGDTPVLENINLEAKPGEMVAFVGHTGAGKTTLINLISRFYDYNSGEIYLDNIPLSTIKRTSLRSHMAFVLQDTFLFETTIRENIRYGRLDATDEEVIEAAKLANAHDFISRLPDGYDTSLDEASTILSEGQKQLLTISRAMIANPTILILDEATSNIDTVTELLIQDSLKRLMKGRTSFIIAHRLNTIRQADQIIMLEHGKIIERGTHESLLKKQGHYYNLYEGVDH
ncbi:MAG TPA: ABC transporter ATP-binding protein [Pseudogracilibacillus sp.]|nr:ABC transporter ATP-binding protein [Pseudogracilibacillus sp.]